PGGSGHHHAAHERRKACRYSGSSVDRAGGRDLDRAEQVSGCYGVLPALVDPLGSLTGGVALPGRRAVRLSPTPELLYRLDRNRGGLPEHGTVLFRGDP